MKKLKLHELGRVSIEEYQEVKKVPLIVVLDNIRSAMNVGSIFRTSDAMAVSQVYLCGISATPPNREITKTAIGATDAVSWKYFDTTAEAISSLRTDDFEIVAIEQTDSSVELMKYKPTKPNLAIILGNEVNGVDSEILPLIDGAIEIDQYGTKHSLNVSVCGGIVIHHLAGLMRH
jgi:tRNA G18 (ribose-2'-O)-methylase SpoU